ncbi:MAG: 2-isopropylmalate synthase [Actinobacteria bacterium]|nr:2-isopropylmalate synthase [Actinomycetota bacterium]
MAVDKNRIYLFDTTLRDGEQLPGISLSTREKLEIAEQLARLGVDVIEAGFPITSQGDFEAVSTIAKKVREPIIAALARAVDADIDRAAEAIKEAEHSRIHTFIMTSDIQIEHQLRKTRDDVLKMAVHAVERAKSYVEDVEFSPMDATRSDFDFLCRVLDAVIESGATVVNIPDTVGYATPGEFGKLIADLINAVPAMKDVVVSVHCHNDLGMATANALAAIMNGAMQVEGTINGLGERAGNTALEEIAMILDTRGKTLGKYTNIRTEEISRTSRLVSNLTGYQVQPNKAIVGRNAFAHSSGIHQDGVLKERLTFEIIDPKKVGISESSLILGKTSGRHAFRKHIESLGYQLDDDELESAFLRFKDLADKKAEITDVDVEAILADEVRTASNIFTLEYIHVSSGTDTMPTATVRLRKNGKVIEKTSTGDGQVDAACKAIKRATGVKGQLISYNVSSITEGLDAQGDVTIQLEIDGKPVLGRGVSTDIIEASAKAYLNAINKALSI